MNDKVKGSGPQPGSQGAPRNGDALDKSGHADPAKLKENRDQRLHVGPDHKTAEMKKGKRGTFP